MENTLFIIAIVFFVAAAALAVASVVIFTRNGVLDAIRFLQGRRVPAKSKAAKAKKGRDLRHPAAGRVGQGGAGGHADRDAVTSGAAVGGSLGGSIGRAPRGDDAPTSTVAQGADDSKTEAVAPLKKMAEAGKTGDTQRTSRVIARAAAPAPVPDEDVVAEQPTEVLSHEDADVDSEYETGLLTEEEAGPEESERPTGLLEEEESEQPTGLLAADESGDAEESERPTGLLESEDERDASERPTGVLDAEGIGESERPTGVLGEQPGEDAEESEQATSLLSEEAAGEESEAETGVLPGNEALPARAPHEEEPAPQPVPEPVQTGNAVATEENDKVAQQLDEGFAFTLKQNIIVVHASDSL